MHKYPLVSGPSRHVGGLLTLSLAAGALLLAGTGCGSSPGNNKIAITSVPDARLYGIGGIESAGFPNDVTVFEGPLSSQAPPPAASRRPL